MKHGSYVNIGYFISRKQQQNKKKTQKRKTNACNKGLLSYHGFKGVEGVLRIYST